MCRHLLAALALWAPLSLLAQGRDLPDFADLAEKQGPAVVNISTTSTARGPQVLPPGAEDDPFFDFFRRFGPPQPREYEARSLGSGFIVSQDGHILTNAHVVEAADEITVRLTDKREYKAKVIGTDKRTDVAVLKIDPTGALPIVAIGDPNKLRVGEWVVAIGSPFGFENTVTAGIVSAKGRSLPQENFVPFLQTDVAINPGNSGGPLFNLKGEVVGINNMIFSRTGGFMGVSFAIPIDVAIDVAKQLQATGRVSRGRIGVVIQEVTKELAESFGLPKPTGALVNSVEKGGPAEKAGIQASDVILKFDNKEIGSSNELPRIVAATRPGAKVGVQVWRKGERKDLQVTVGETPEERTAKRPQGRKPSGETLGKIGLTVSELSADQRRELNVSGGVLVDSAEGSAARAGIRRGDVILAVGNAEVKSVEELNRLLGGGDKPRTVALLVRRGEGSIYIPLRIDGN
ncbi:MAG TPA: DegQ family serine endoprotease [Burkholderiales bacterium]|nr:DegQ family serine endoprotease [Burkholderiales bacterium]